MSNSGIQALKGTWDYVDSENFDEYMKEVGIGFVMRKAAGGLKPHVVISEDNGKWTLRSENKLKTTTINFTPGVQFEDTIADGREVISIVNFEGNKWIHTSVDKHGKEYVVTRYIDDKGQQVVEMQCGSVKARRWFKRVE